MIEFIYTELGINMPRKRELPSEKVNIDFTHSSLFDAVDDEISAKDLGERFREIRQNHGYTLSVLAQKSGVSLNALSMIENGKTSPSVGTLQQAARAMRISIVDFFQKSSPEEKVIFVPDGQGPQISLVSHQLEHLGKNYIHGAVQPFKVKIPPQTGSGSQEISHSGHEFVYCLSGEMDYRIQERTYKLRTGSSLMFLSELPHKWINQSENEAILLLIFIPGCSEEMTLLGHFNTTVKDEENENSDYHR